MNAGHLATLLRLRPAIEVGLKEFLDRQARPHKLTPRALSCEFVVICIANGVAADQFPFCASDQGHRALMRWFNAVYLVNSAAICTRPNRGRNAAAARLASRRSQ